MELFGKRQGAEGGAGRKDIMTNTVFEVVIERDAAMCALMDATRIRTITDMMRYVGAYARDFTGDAWWHRYDDTAPIADDGNFIALNKAAHDYEGAYNGIDSGAYDFEETRYIIVIEFDGDGNRIDYAIGSRRFEYNAVMKRVFWF